MKNNLLSIALLVVCSFSFAQNGKNVWQPALQKSGAEVVANKTTITNPNLFSLDISALKQKVSKSPKRFSSISSSNTVVAFPNADGQMEKFRIEESSNMDPALAARYPQIKSYVGQGIENPSSMIFFSISPLGLQTMTIGADRSAVFIEPYNSDLSTYVVYKKSDKSPSLDGFECKLANEVEQDLNLSTSRPNADDAVLRTFRLALSVTGEYTNYFGGTKALALAAMNNTMTRVNAVFEKDFSIRMVMIANNDNVIYTNATADPFSSSATGSGGAWISELQGTLTSVIGDSNYDIGHLFGGSGGGGNAGCIGCVCVNGSKGRGFTSPGNGQPFGDNFDIDYVAHEMGHQFGASHTFSHSFEGSGSQMEPGSGSTIMGYAGITSKDVQPHSDAYFHAVSIQQVTNNVKMKSCQTNTPTGNSIPVVNGGSDYTIPKSTPFMLTATASDANGDTMTYDWEQFDSGSLTENPSSTKATGPIFRSYAPTTSPTRYFPKMATILAGSTNTVGTELTVEALPSIARLLNFRLTVRDNRAGGSGNNSDDVKLTVSASAGPFTVTSPNTAVSYAGGSTQTVQWNVAGTTSNGVNCANVDILLSKDGGSTFPITLLSNTPNDGTQSIVIPNNPGSQNRIMIKGSNHIFFDVSNANFTITAGSADTVVPTTPILASVSGTTQTTTNLSWSTASDNIGIASYSVYQSGAYKASVTGTSYTVTGLNASTVYTYTVKAKDAAGNLSASSNSQTFTTASVAVDNIAPTPATLSASGTTNTTTNLSWTAGSDNIGITGYEIYQNGALKTTVTSTSYTVTGLTLATTYTFFVKAKDAAINRSVNSNTVTVLTTGAPVPPAPPAPPVAPAVTYCTSAASSAAYEQIANVKFNTINNSSTGGTGYTNFTSISTTVSRGASHAITITPKWSSSTYSEGYAVFIDYNGDGDFTDAGETVFSKVPSKSLSIVGTVTIPTNATIGSTRMRVVMRYSALPVACGAFNYGQVEDYTINIIAGGKGAELTEEIASSNDLRIYPNPVSGDILNISAIENATYRVINILGQEIAKGNIENNSIPVADFHIGTYLLQITSNGNTVVKRFIKN